MLQKRRDDKAAAKNEWHKLISRYETDPATMDKRALAQLKKQFVYMSYEKIELVKNLIRAYGATYYDAPGEADELCAMLVIKKKVWACLSEDMDMFVYGCNRVLRYLNLTNQTIVLYYTKGILENLNMSQKEFREICVLSGTDYNINVNVLNLFDIINLFYKFQQGLPNQPFYDWLNLDLDLDLLKKINSMFDISNELTNSFKNIQILNGPIQKNLIKEIMKEDGFLFLD